MLQNFGLEYLLQRNCLGGLGMNGKILEKDLWKLWDGLNWCTIMCLLFFVSRVTNLWFLW